MKLVMTLLARDEADIVDDNVKFHLNAGVDFVLAMDNLSQDGTTEILESYARSGDLHLIRQDSEYLRQADWITEMGRMAISLLTRLLDGQRLEALHVELKTRLVVRGSSGRWARERS